MKRQTLLTGAWEWLDTSVPRRTEADLPQVLAMHSLRPKLSGGLNAPS